MTQHFALLNEILVRIQTLGPRALVVFDLDSTLFDVSPRTQKILVDFVATPEHRLRYPQSVEILQKVQVLPVDWGMKEGFRRLGLDSHPKDFQNAVRAFWVEKFFSGDYLIHDRPIDGAVEFTNQVAASGAHIVYLTGRSFQQMAEATQKVLDMHDFPKGELALKMDLTVEDAFFKAEWFSSQALDSYQSIFFFENEPLNLNLVAEQHPFVEIIFVDTTHSGKFQALDCWRKIPNFLRSE